jgi:acyl-CoA thioesterase
VAQHAAITFVRPGRVGELLVAEAAERMHAGRSGMYDVRVCTAEGELVAEFRGHTRSIRRRSEG